MTDALDASVRQWALSLEGRLHGETGASVYAARRGDDGTPVVLKLPDLDEREAEHEADALACWDGDGAVRVLEYDRDRRALLLERLIPGTSAWEVDEDEATRAVAGVLRRLAIEPPTGHPFRPLADAARGWAEDFAELRPVVEELLADATSQVLLHQDLHGGNVLRRGDDWVAIDPKPLVGDPAFDVASLVRDRRPIRDRRVIERRLDLLVDELGHDRERMRLWSWVHAVVWGWPDEARLIHSLPHYHRRVAWRDWVETVEVEPSLYAADFARLGEQIDELLDAGVRVFHYDVGDGHFVEPITIGPIVIESIAERIHAGGAAIDVHLMVDNPERHVPQVAKAGGDSVTFHVEVTDEPEALIALAREHGLGAGVAFNPETEVARAAAAAEGADLCLCMSIHPGYSGQAFMPEALPRIRELRSLLPADVLVQVDGGVGAANIAAIHEAGASLLVAGSAVFAQGDLRAAYRGLVQALR